VSFGILPHGQQLKRNLDANVYSGARGQKNRNMEAFKTEKSIESGYVNSGLTGAGAGAGLGFVVGGPVGAGIGAIAGGVGGFLADFFL
jgi:outer membrane lipoprotein SlyB